MRVAIIGASSNRNKYGNKAVRSYVAQGYDVVPVNPNEPEVEGLRTYPRVTDIPGDVERALLYVPPGVGVAVLPDLAAKGVKEVYVNPGAESDELFEKAQQLGLNTIFACAIVDIGDTPSRYR
jgi:uncharacterized protein